MLPKSLAVLVALLAWTAAPTPAQVPSAPPPDTAGGPLAAAQAALAECLLYTQDPDLRERKDEAKAAAERAEKAFRAAVAAEPRNPEAHAGLGITLARCASPHAGVTTIMNVAESATASLEQALRLAPEHWQARFTLAMLHFNMPAFLNRTPDAIRELETLRAQQRERNDAPHLALVWLRLGDAYERVGRSADARAAYATGARLFPDNAELQRKAEEAGADLSGAAPGEDDPAARAPAPTPAATGPDQVVHALAPLRVEAAQPQLEGARSGTSLKRIDVYTMPGGTGEMLQTLQSLPGTTRAGDGADLYVRGGDPEETPIFVNGGRMAFPGRWEGLSGATMGVLDASALQRAYFSAGGFSAKYGNALSGIVDVEALGRPAEASWRAGFNLVSAGAGIQRPLGRTAGVWSQVLLTDVTLLARTQGQEDRYPDMPRSYQWIAGGGVKASEGVELKALVLASGDESARLIDAGAHRGAFASSGSTQHGALSGRWISDTGRAGVNASVSASRRTSGFSFGVLERDREDRAYGARVDGDVVSAGGTRIRTGAELTLFDALSEGQVPLTPSVAPGSPAQVLAGVREDATHVGGYAELEQPLATNLFGVVGVRADRLPGSDDVTLDPRAAIAYAAGPWTLRGGAGIFHQGAWRRGYRLPDAGTPAGIPTRARHLVVGAERTGEPALRVEAYTKWYDDYQPADASGPPIVAGTSQGIDAIVRWQRQPRLNGWLTYGLLDSRVELENGDDVSARYDVTHTLTAVARYALTEAWELGTTFRYGTGKPYTPILGGRPSEVEGWPVEPVYGELQSERLPYYGRIDGRITRYQRLGSGFGVFYLEMLDLNGRRNVIGYEYTADFQERRPMESFFARRTFVFGAELRY